MNCANCGRPAPAGARFCSACGTQLAGAAPATEPSVTHPLAEGWAPAPPPPPRRRVGPALLAAAMGVALLFGSVGLVAARAVGAHASGASTPEAAATGLLDASNHHDLTRAATYLRGEERQLLTTYHNRLNQLLTGQGAPSATSLFGSLHLHLPTPLASLDLTTRDVRFQRVGGSRDVAVLEAVSGTVGIRDQGGALLEVPITELRDQLAEASGGRLASLRLVTVRAGGHWYVNLLASAAEFGRLADGGAQVNYATLTASDATGGASSADAAVRAAVGTLASGGPQELERLAPDERAVLRTYAGALPQLRQGTAEPVTVEGLTTRTERVSGEVTRVYLTGGRIRGPNGEVIFLPSLSDQLSVTAGKEREPYVVAVEQNGSWYPSLLFTATDYALTTAQQEQS